MLLTILLTILICVFTQLLISQPDKILDLLLYISSVSLVKKYLPFIHTFMVNYHKPKQPIQTNNSGVYTSPRIIPVDEFCPDTNILCPNPAQKKDTFDEKVKKYEEDNKTKVIFINHKKQSGPLGLSFLETHETLSLTDSKKFVDIMREIKADTSVTLIINTCGGSLLAAEVIMNSLLNHPGKIITYIPYQAMSAGTLIALSSDEIHMDTNAYCGKIDPQMWISGATDIVKYSNTTRAAQSSFIGDMLALMGSQARDAIERVNGDLRNICKKMTSYNHDLISEELVYGNYNHDQPLFGHTMKRILPNVTIGIPNDIMELYNASNK